MNRLKRWWLERQAKRQVDALRARCEGHWIGARIDRQWTDHDQDFFLSAARRDRGLS